MENNDNTQEETREEEASTEDVKNEEEKTSEGDTKDWKADALKYKAIAERKEKKLRDLSSKEETTSNKPNDGLSEDYKEELRMIAGGVSDEEIGDLKTIAKGKGITMAEAKKDPMFKMLKEQREQRVERDSAQLGASTGGAVETDAPAGDEAIKKKHSEMLAKFKK